MWNKKRSILLSKVFVVIFLVALIACMATGPWLVDWVMIRSHRAQLWQVPWFLATVYVGGVLAVVMLVQLLRVLVNVGRGDVFSHKNVSMLRMISWLCLIGGAVCLASSFYYLPWLIVFIVAAFVGLIVRIVKNILAEAIYLKEENDYTI